MKGHVQIQLKNEKTGHVDVYEQDNMVTSAVAKVLGLTANISAAASSSTNLFYWLLPVAEKVLGGLCLFDGRLKEDVNNVHFPMDVHLTGCAGREANTASKLTGSLNQAESGRTDHGYTSVWEFTTSQANGVISSLALTHYSRGNSLFWNDHYTVYSVSGSQSLPVAYNDKNGMLYYYRAGKIYVKQICSEIIQTASPFFSASEEVFDFGFSSSDTLKNYLEVQNGYDGYLYALYPTYDSRSQSTNIRIIKVKISDFSFEKEEDSLTISNIHSAGVSDYYYLANFCSAVSKGYLYLRKYDNKSIYKIDLSNTANVKEIVLEDCLVTGIYPQCNGGLFAQFSWETTTTAGSTETRRGVGIVYPDGKYIINSDKYDTSSYAPSISAYFGIEGDNLFVCKGAESSRYGFAANYLGTICNLSSPVVKTSEQSMKITYTLTDV